ncbi:MAG: (Na+)-NQR maturation NqrM [Pseudomonadota bacterium]
MIEFLLSFAILLLVVAAMAVGVMRGRKPLTGSCGGLNNLGIGGACEICGGDMSRCEESREPDRSKSTGKFYDAA